MWRSNSSLTVNQPLVSIVIPTWNGGHLIEPCLESLQQQTYENSEIIVVDGGSHDGTRELVNNRFPSAKLLALPRNRGFAGNVNAGLRHAGGEIVCLLNNDAVADAQWVEQLVACIRDDPRTGSCASKMLDHDGARLDSAGDLLGANGLAWQRGAGELDLGQYDTSTHVFSACGGAAAYRRDMLNDVGILDEGYGSYLEDVDLGLRAQLRGWQCRFEPTATVRHIGSATGGGSLASFHVARNSIRLIARGFPTPVLRDRLRSILVAQAQRGMAAVRAWRGEAARATLRGMLAGLVCLPPALRGRAAIQSRRLISNEQFMALLSDRS
jgi:GT2 family glycosyltransferase